MDVLFAVLPFLDIGRPAIGVSLLKAEIARYGFSSCVRYFNLDHAERIGIQAYSRIASSSPGSLLGEWFFASVLFGDKIPHEQEYISKVLLPYPETKDFVPDLLKARQSAAAFVDKWAAEIRDVKPSLVGFTTTFHQTCACLAVAKRLKEGPDPPIIVFGGGNCEGEMGLEMIRSFPWIDYVCIQEGDAVFPEFLRSLFGEGNPKQVGGILGRGEAISAGKPLLVEDLDSLPLPDYDDYFQRLGRSELKENFKPEVLVETSRGCWWGAKNHCTFCGLNGATMAFRSKSPERAFHEFRALSERYGIKRIECVDNILDTKYLHSLFPKLSESRLGIELFYEVKANLRYDQLVTLRAGGVWSIQPGIESFSNQVLRLMKKGCTGLQNIQLLRWCEELGMEVAWNIIGGFPGESPAEYNRMAELIPSLVHLPHPSGVGPFRLDRFSPFFTQSEQFGLLRVRPMPAYYYVYPLGRRALARLAYYFDFDYSDDRAPLQYIGGLYRQVQNWWKHRSSANDSRPRLDAIGMEDGLAITDTRPGIAVPETRLKGLAARLYTFCDSAQSIKAILREFAGETEEMEIIRELQNLISGKLMVEMDGQYLSLAVFRNRPAQWHGKSRVEQQDVYVQITQAAAPQPLLRPV
jgi:ribosomal peptide maturation radical SAM protein 1